GRSRWADDPIPVHAERHGRMGVQLAPERARRHGDRHRTRRNFNTTILVQRQHLRCRDRRGYIVRKQYRVVLWVTLLMVLVAFGFVGVAKCQTAVTGTEFRFTSRSAPGALANRYRLFISSTTGQLGCVTPSGASCLVLSGGAVAWGSLTGVPSTFPPSAHTHSGGD